MDLINLGSRSFEKRKSSKHHIIPIHDGGSPDKWNILKVSKEEHDQIHRLRYEVYHHPVDKLAIRATANDAKMASSVVRGTNPVWISSGPVVPLELQEHNSNQSLSSICSTGEGEEKEQTNCKIDKESKESKYLFRRTPETLKAIEKGMVWKHKQGFEVIIKPNTVQTVEQVKELLINSLPQDKEFRQRIEKNKTSVNYIRQVINNVFGEQPHVKKSRVYGFSLDYYS